MVRCKLRIPKGNVITVNDTKDLQVGMRMVPAKYNKNNNLTTCNYNFYGFIQQINVTNKTITIYNLAAELEINSLSRR